MTTLIKPFRGLRPAPEHASDVVAPPYDVLNTAEARARAEGRPLSFLHISKPEIDLPEDTDPYVPEVYAKGAENFSRLIDDGVLLRELAPAYYAYRLTMGEHAQTGFVCVGNVADYDSNRIRKHEFTRPQKEDDRVRQITALQAQTGPVLLTYRSDKRVAELLAKVARRDPLYDLVADDGIGHTLWRIDERAEVEALTKRVDAMDALYIADGHHRSASASRVAAARRAKDADADGDQSYDYFLCVAFAHDAMQILDYNRVVRDLNGLSPAELVEKAAESFTVSRSDEPAKPAEATHFGMYVGGRWYRLELKPDLLPEDPVASLDVSLLQNLLLAPVLGIGDPRTDSRIEFVGGIRGLAELSRRVDSGEMAAGFALFPTSMEALMAVADAGEVMPPKSTWFEPKLADGLISHILD